MQFGIIFFIIRLPSELGGWHSLFQIPVPWASCLEILARRTNTMTFFFFFLIWRKHFFTRYLGLNCNPEAGHGNGIKIKMKRRALLGGLVQLETLSLIQGALRVRTLAHDLTGFWIKPCICPRRETYTCSSSMCALENNMKSFSMLWQTEGSYMFAIQKKLFLINSTSKQF